MKLQILSDIHLEHHRPATWDRLRADIQTDADVLILAGDCVSLRGQEIKWSVARIKELAEGYRRLMFVPGNHEYYGTRISQGMSTLVSELKDVGCENIDVLTTGQPAYYEGQRFLGDTMWQPWESGTQEITDHRLIWKFRPEAAARYAEFERWLDTELSDRDIVVTHHAPSEQSLAPEFVGNLANRWFITPEVEPLLLERKPKLWVHGHTHNTFDYELRSPPASTASTRVICNPRGYPGEETGFNPKLVVEV